MRSLICSDSNEFQRHVNFKVQTISICTTQSKHTHTHIETLFDALIDSSQLPRKYIESIYAMQHSTDSSNEQTNTQNCTERSLISNDLLFQCEYLCPHMMNASSIPHGTAKPLLMYSLCALLSARELCWIQTWLHQLLNAVRWSGRFRECFVNTLPFQDNHNVDI